MGPSATELQEMTLPLDTPKQSMTRKRHQASLGLERPTKESRNSPSSAAGSPNGSDSDSSGDSSSSSDIEMAEMTPPKQGSTNHGETSPPASMSSASMSQAAIPPTGLPP